MPIETEAEHWVSPSSDAVQELEALRSATGFSTELGFMVRADDVTADDVVAWIYRFQTTELQRHPGQLLQAASMPGVAAGRRRGHARRQRRDHARRPRLSRHRASLS